MKTTTISFWGGFHEVRPIKLRFKNTPKFKVDLEEVLSGHSDLSMFDLIRRNASSGQERKIDNHFCGMSDCQCGSYYRNLHYKIIPNIDLDNMTDANQQV